MTVPHHRLGRRVLRRQDADRPPGDVFQRRRHEFQARRLLQRRRLANRILIENDDPRITHSLTDGSQLNTYQYRGGTFYVGGASNQYVTTKASLTPRKVLQVVGGRDDVIPPEGGASSEIEDGEGGTLAFVPWQESALAIATAYGYTGAQAALSPDNPNFAKASYLSGQVVAVNLKKVGHVAGPFEAAKAVDLAALLAPPPSATAEEDDEDDIVDDNGARDRPSACWQPSSSHSWL